jgi:hypothetical protein
MISWMTRPDVNQLPGMRRLAGRLHPNIRFGDL